MNTAVAPSPAQFQAGALEHFGFLVRDHGFQVSQPPVELPQSFIVYFAKPGAYVAVIGYSYGFALDVELGPLRPDGTPTERVSQWILMQLRTPEHLAPRFGGERGQIEQMRFMASVLPLCAADALRGDFSVLPSAKQLRQNLAQEAEDEHRRRELSRASAQASDAFHAGQYARTVALLQPFQSSLSRAQAAMLRLAITKSSA
jgi:hypothetical protein